MTHTGCLTRSISSLDEVKPGDHLCAIYETEEEHRALLTAYIRRGLEMNEKVIYIVDARTSETIRGYLRAEGVDVEPYLKNGQLSILTADQSYMRDGIFVPERMIDLLRQETERAISEGYHALRATGEMSWVLRGYPGSERLMEYEAKLNDFFPRNSAVGLCQYDRRRFSADDLIKVLATHPIAAIGTEIYENLYYMGTEEFLAGNLSENMLSNWIKNIKEKNAGEQERKQHREQLEHLVEERTEEIEKINRELQNEIKERRQREEMYRAILQTSIVGFWLTDLKGNFLEVNDAYLKLTGYTREEFLGMKISDIEEMESSKDTRRHIKQIEGTGFDRFETRHRCKDGRVIDVEVNVNHIAIEEGRLFVFLQDITRKKLEAEKLRKSEERLRDAQRIGHMGNWDWNMVTGDLFWSDEIYEIFGLTPREFGATYKAFLDSVHADDREYVTKSVNEAVNEGKKYSIDHRIIRPDESIRTVHEQGEVTLDKEGRPVRMIGTVQDITEKKRAEEAVNDERQRFSNVLDMLPAYLVLLTPDYHVSFANRFFRERFGESHGRCCYDYLFGRSEPCEICETYKVLKKEAPLEWEWTGPDGRNYYIFDFPFRDIDGSNLIMEVGLDVTIQKQAEQKLREQASLLDLAHDAILVRDRENKISFWNRGEAR